MTEDSPIGPGSTVSVRCQGQSDPTVPIVGSVVRSTTHCFAARFESLPTESGEIVEVRYPGADGEPISQRFSILHCEQEADHVIVSFKTTGAPGEGGQNGALGVSNLAAEVSADVECDRGCPIMDIVRGGIFVVTKQAHPVGSRVRVRLCDLRAEHSSCTGTFSVQGVQSDGAGAALSHLSIDPEQPALVEFLRVVAMRLQDAPLGRPGDSAGGPAGNAPPEDRSIGPGQHERSDPSGPVEPGTDAIPDGSAQSTQTQGPDGQDPDPNDRRTHPRKQFEAGAFVRIVSRHEDVRLEVQTVELSSGGMCFRSFMPLESGAILVIELVSNKRGPWMIARVIHCEETGTGATRYRIGIEFLKVHTDPLPTTISKKVYNDGQSIECVI